MKYKLPYFEELDTNELEDYYDVEIEMEGRLVSLDLNLDPPVDVAMLDLVREQLEELRDFVDVAKDGIKGDFQNEQSVYEYMEWHLDLLESGELNDALAGVDANLSDREKLFSLLHLVRIGFYPSEEDAHVTLDFSIGRNLTDYLVVVSMNDNRDVTHITTES